MFAAGFKTIESIAASNQTDLVQAVKNLNMKQAERIIGAARHSLLESIATYQERLDEMKEVIKPNKKKSNRQRQN